LSVNKPYTLTLQDTPDSSDVDFVNERLKEYNRAIVGDDNHRKLVILLRDADDTIVGGLLGGTYWGWLHIDVLWIKDSLRRQGYGQTLLAAAEQEAIKRGCRYAHLDTMSFQALSFYEKQGYTIFGELDDLPVGHSRLFLKKELVSPRVGVNLNTT
jgi:ribosomal protein S18 acetylase RimI-like enzyme